MGILPITPWLEDRHQMTPPTNQPADDTLTFEKSEWEAMELGPGDSIRIEDKPRQILGVTRSGENVSVRLESPRSVLKPDEMRAAREQLGLTRAEFSEALAVGQRSVRNWENGVAEPAAPAMAMLRILEFLDRKGLLGEWKPRVRFAAAVREIKPGHLRELRDSLGLTQAAMASSLGIPERTLQRWEQADWIPEGTPMALVSATMFIKEKGLVDEWLNDA